MWTYEQITEKLCKNCEHYHQHFTQHMYGNKAYYTPLFEGHCVAVRIKKRKPFDKGCKFFENKYYKNKGVDKNV